MRTVWRIALIFLGALGICDTIALLQVSNGNLGTILPFILGLPLLLLGVFFNPVAKWFKIAALGKVFVFAVASAYALFFAFIAIVGGFIHHAGSQEPPPNADALIVLGAAVRGERLSLTLKNRLDAALDYLEGNENTIVFVSGGQGRGESVTEAFAMKRYLMSAGIDEGRIVMEDKASSTLENFGYTKPLIDAFCGKDARIVFVTTDFHVFRATLVAKSCGIVAHGIGADGVWYVAPNDYMRECAALTVYYVTGKI